MQPHTSYLKLLLGKKVSKAYIESPVVASLSPERGEAGPGSINVHLHLTIGDYQLQIFKLINYTPATVVPEDLIGLTVLEANENKNEANIIFTGGIGFSVALRNDADSDPEAMFLAGPNAFGVGWN